MSGRRIAACALVAEIALASPLGAAEVSPELYQLSADINGQLEVLGAGVTPPASTPCAPEMLSLAKEGIQGQLASEGIQKVTVKPLETGGKLALGALGVPGGLLTTYSLMRCAMDAQTPDEFRQCAVGEAIGYLLGRGLERAQVDDLIEVRATNQTGRPVTVRFDDALAFEAVRVPAAPGASMATRDTLRGFCADFAKPPPAPGTVYRLAGRDVQQRLSPLRHLLQAGRRMAAEGRLHPDSAPDSYADSIRQWALWSRIEGFDERRYADAFVEHTRKNVGGAGQRWTRELEAGVRAAVPNRWRDITAVLTAAKELAQGR